MTYDKYMQIMRNQPGLVGCWMFHKNNGNHLHDYSRHGNHGTIGGATFRGNYGAGARYFDGVNDYVDLGKMGTFGSDINSDEATFRGWLKTQQSSALIAIIAFNRGGTWSTTGYFRVELNKDSDFGDQPGAWYIHWKDYNDDNLRGGIDYDTGVTDGSWHQFTITLDGVNVEFDVWINGRSQSITYVQQSPNFHTIDFDDPLFLGARNSSTGLARFFPGLLDEVSIYNRALSADEVKRSYDLGKQFHID